MAQITDVASNSTTKQQPSRPAPSTTGREWDSIVAPPESKRSRFNWRKWRARLVVLLMVGLAVFAATRLAESRRASTAQFAIGMSTLTAQPISIETTQAGQVNLVDIAAGDSVAQGQVVGTMITTTTTAAGKLKEKTVELEAPAAGVIIGDPTPIGGIVQPGQPFAKLYNPNVLTLVSTIPVKDLSHVSIGMKATLRADGLTTPVNATVKRIVPVVATQAQTGQIAASQNRLQVVLTPDRPEEVANLVPGIHFTGTVDTSTGPATAPDGLHVNN